MGRDGKNQNYIDKDELAPAKRKEAEYKSVPYSILHEFYVNCAPGDIPHYHVNSNFKQRLDACNSRCFSKIRCVGQAEGCAVNTKAKSF